MGMGSWRVNESTDRSRAWRAILLLMLLALLVRAAVIPFLIGDQLDPARDHWAFGCEEGRIARSLVNGEGFSSPLFARTGPTAWTTPVYPAILAGVFRIFGTFTPAAAWAALLLNAIFAALTVLPVYFLTRRFFGGRAAFWAGLVWALHPYSIFISSSLVWDYTLDALLLALVLWATAALEASEDRAGLLAWAGYGILWGVAALTNAVMLATLPFLLGWIAWRRHRRGLGWSRQSVAALLLLTLTVAPWFARNYSALGRFVPFRDTFWLVFWQGNTGDGSDLYPDWTNPAHNDAELAKYYALGELGYMREKRAASLHYLRQHAGLFLRTSVRRFFFTWTGYWSLSREYREAEPLTLPNIGFCTALTALLLAGLRKAWRQNREAVIPLALVLLVYPLIYYFTHPGIEYRHPLDTVAAVFIGVLFARGDSTGAGAANPAAAGG